MTDFVIPNHDGVLDSPVQRHYDAGDDPREKWYADFWFHRAQTIEAAIVRQKILNQTRLREIMEQMCELYADQMEEEHGS